MKTLALIVSVTALLVTAPATAQNATYACQFIQSAGMNKEPAGWKIALFNSPEPFFLRILNGRIDKKNLQAPPLGLRLEDTSCFKSDFNNPIVGQNHWCASDIRHLSFSEKTLNGGLAATFGAIQPSTDTNVDSVVVSRFKCQKVG